MKLKTFSFTNIKGTFLIFPGPLQAFWSLRARFYQNHHLR